MINSSAVRIKNKGCEDEYDILLVNGRAICIVEVKYKADSGIAIMKQVGDTMVVSDANLKTPLTPR